MSMLKYHGDVIFDYMIFPDLLMAVPRGDRTIFPPICAVETKSVDLRPEKFLRHPATN